MLKRLTAGVFALAVAFLLAGTGFADDKPTKDKPDPPKPEKLTPDLLMKDAIKLMGEFADTFEKIKDKASAEKAKPKLVDLTKRFKKLNEQGRKIVDALPKEEQEALQKKYKDDLEKVTKRLIAETGRLNKDPEIQAVLKEVEKEATKDDKKDDKKDEKKADKKDADKKDAEK
jgi:hypothetical protein